MDLCYCVDVEGQTKIANKRPTSQSFEVYLEAPTKPSPSKPQSKTPFRKDLSMEELQKRLEAADDRRKVSSGVSTSRVSRPSDAGDCSVLVLPQFCIPHSRSPDPDKKVMWQGELTRHSTGLVLFISHRFVQINADRFWSLHQKRALP